MRSRIKAWVMAWWKGWSHYECASLSAATAYYAALSIIPLMLVLMAATGAFFALGDRGRDAKAHLLEVIAVQASPEFSEALGKLLSDLGNSAAVSGPLAGLGLVFTASLVFAQIDRGFGRIWEVEKRVQRPGVMRAAGRAVLGRLRSLMFVGLASATVLLIFVAGPVIRGAMAVVSEHWPQIDLISAKGSLLLGFGTNVLCLMMIYRLLSKERVPLRLCFHVGVFAGVLWEIGSQVLMALSFGKHYGIYGHVGSVLVVLVWLHYTSMVLFTGAIMLRNVSVSREREGSDR